MGSKVIDFSIGTIYEGYNSFPAKYDTFKKDLFGTGYDNKKKALKWILDNYSLNLSDPLRFFQIKMIELIVKAEKSPFIENLIPFFFQDANIWLFYDVAEDSIVIFFQEKYEEKYSGEPIVSDIVKVDCRLREDFVGYGCYLSYAGIWTNEKNQILIKTTKEMEKSSSHFQYLYTHDSRNKVKENYENKDLIRYYNDRGKPRYLVEKKVDEKLALDLASIQFYYLRQTKYYYGEGFKGGYWDTRNK